MRFSPIAFLLGGIFLTIYLKIHFLGLIFTAALGISAFTLARYRWMQFGLGYVLVFLIFLVAQSLLVQLFVYPVGTLDTTRYIVYMTTNMIILVATLGLVSRYPLSRDRSLLIAMTVMLVLGVAEVYLGFRPLFDAIRQLYTSDNSFYDAVDRDLLKYGQVRATIFTSEPSSAGNFFGALWLAYVALPKRRKRHVLAAVLLLAASLVIIRSPTILSYVAVAPAMILLQRDHRVIGYGYLSILLVALPIVFFYGWLDRYSISNPSLREFFSTGSFFIRQISPLYTVQLALADSPIFGSGVGYQLQAKDLNLALINWMYGNVYSLDVLTKMPPGQFVTNASWELVGVLGIGGFLVFWALLLRLMARFGIRNGFGIMLAFLVIAMNHAGIVGAFTWSPLMLMAFAFAPQTMRNRRHTEPEADSPALIDRGGPRPATPHPFG